MSNPDKDWTLVGQMSDLVKNSGVCARLGSRQVALFYVPGAPRELYATGNWDPKGGAAVLSRGMLADLQGALYIASPLYKHHYSLETGACLEDPTVSIPVYEARHTAEGIWLKERVAQTEAA